ncbi:MAG: hypothetical protein AAF483_19160 [Planctomycetota bacterium]
MSKNQEAGKHENPYHPPTHQNEITPEGQSSFSRVLRELLRAFVVLIGILFGWIIITIGLSGSGPFYTVLGTIVILGSLGIEFWARRKYRLF